MTARAPDAVVWDFLRGAMMTKALGTVADFGVADVLGDGPRPVEDVASQTGAHPDTLHRLLRALASDGVFAEVEPGTFQNTEASELLRSGEPTRDFANLFGDVWYRAIADFDARSDEASFPRTFGTEFWSWLAQHPDERAAFDRAMEDGTQSRVDRLETRDWLGDETVVDVGGGNGSLLVELLRRRPGLRGIVFDLPETNRDEAALGERIEFVAGSFFESVPTGDVYILGTILHDWDDERAAAILRTIRASAPSTARLVVIDSIVPDGNEPDGSKWLDLLMLTLFGGRERNETQWRSLLAGSGFEPVSMENRLIEARCR